MRDHTAKSWLNLPLSNKGKVVQDNLTWVKAIMNKTTEEAVIRGREAWERLKKDLTWEDWMLTGIALTIGRDECLGVTHANSIDDKRYRNEFSVWLKENRFGDMDKAARSRLFKCMDHRAGIEAWRATLPISERLKLNHPNSVLRKWETATTEGRATRPPAKPGARDEVVRLQEELDAANRKIRNLEDGDDRGPLITRTDTIDDLVRTLMEWLPASKRHPVASGMMRALKATEPKPKGPHAPVAARRNGTGDRMRSRC